jgi:hypothetical protein
MNVRDAIGGVGPGPVAKFRDPPPVPDKKNLWDLLTEKLRQALEEPAKTKGEELKPGPVPPEEAIPHEEVRRIF